MNDEVFQRAKEERLLLKTLEYRRHSWLGRTVRYNEFLVNILEGAISRKKGRGKASTTILKASRQKHRSWQLYNSEKNGLQQLQMESCQAIKRLKDTKKKTACLSLSADFRDTLYMCPIWRTSCCWDTKSGYVNAGMHFDCRDVET